MPAPLTGNDRFALADLAARYAVAVDRREFALLRDVFTDDAELDTGRALRTGIAAIIEAMEGLRRYVATSHVVGQQRRAFDDDELTGIVYCEAHHLTDHGDHRTDKVMHIHYHDRYVATPAGWRIGRRALDIRWTDETIVG
ncbi:MAG: nuclear transport factor 2 family protein [Acidimicrobiales bacterium]